MRVLLLEDDDSIRRMVSVLLSARGYDVIASTEGTVALDLAFANKPDCAVLDLALPGVFDGFDVLTRLRANPSTARIRIVVLSAHDDPATQERARSLGADVFLSKPFSAAVLLAALAPRSRP